MNTINTETSYEAYVPADEWTERRKFTKEEKEQILKSTKGVWNKRHEKPHGLVRTVQ